MRRKSDEQGTLALLVHGGTENWSAERWKSRFDVVCGDRGVVPLPDAAFDPALVHYAAVEAGSGELPDCQTCGSFSIWAPASMR
jgi:glyoxylate/hydroxypyruvate reductase A